MKKRTPSAQNFVNASVSDAHRTLGVAAQLQLKYNQPLRVPQYYSAAGKTTQNLSSLSIQNLSAAFALTVFVTPDDTGKHTYTIPANDRTPVHLVQNWNGAMLQIANISQEAATAEVTLVDLG